MSRQKVHHRHAEIEATLSEVCEEMDGHGLLTKGVWRTPVVTTPTDAHIAFAEGLYFIAVDGLWKRLGFRAGTIYVPRRSAGFALRRVGRTRTTMRDVLRHELAHALAYTSGDLVRGDPRFRRAFGDEHDAEGPTGAPRAGFVSDYAMTDPSEDFAESVMCFLRYGGDLARWERRPALLAKMEYVAALPGRIRRRGLGA